MCSFSHFRARYHTLYGCQQSLRIHLTVVPHPVYSASQQPQQMELHMPQSNAQRAETGEGESARGARPVASFKQGGVEVSVWKNHTDKGDMFNTTIRNSYKDDARSEEHTSELQSLRHLVCRLL